MTTEKPNDQDGELQDGLGPRTAPSAFSAAAPKLQLAWDATSLAAIMACPRRYEYSIIEGYQGSSVDLDFGILVHGAMSVFSKARLAGKSRADAQYDAVSWALEHSGQYVIAGGDGQENGHERFIPWGGQYLTQWRCTGTEPYKNEKGNKALCPLSHKGKWQFDDAPSTCGVCGSPTEVADNWVPIDKKKNRYSLIRLVVWYTEEQPEDDASGGLSPVQLPDGTPAVELRFALPLPFVSKGFSGYRGNERFLLAGYLDGIKTHSGAKFIADYKSTGSSLGKAFYARYAPSVQMDTYDLAGSILYPDEELRGVLIEGMQMLVGGVRFGIGPLYHNDAQRAEWLAEIGGVLKLAEGYAEADYWPMNRASCAMCNFKGICSKDPGSRKMYLEAEFTKRVWNPLEDRE